MKLNFQAAIRLAITIIAWAGLFGTSLGLRGVRADSLWYVTMSGKDSNDCLSPTTPCATINGAIRKASAGDTVYVAVGTYTSYGDTVTINKDIKLSGGWNEIFTTQSGLSTIDGGGLYQCVTVAENVNAIIERFKIQNGFYPREGGGIHVRISTLTLMESIIANNTACRDGCCCAGGGIYNYFGNVRVFSSTISSNVATGDGGGIYSYGGTPPATLTIVNSTLLNNRSNNLYGGGIFSAGTLLTILNSTISGNSASYGGGLYHVGLTGADLDNVTITDNSAPNVTGGVYAGGGGGPINLKNTILASNIGPASAPDCSGYLTSQGYNLIRNTAGCTIGGDSTGNLIGADPQLLPLIGIPVYQGYHPLRDISPAIDAGNPTGCTDNQGNSLTTDERGANRVGRCDIGAYEYTIPGPAAQILSHKGTPQSAFLFHTFDMPLQATVLDSIGSPISNTGVSFVAPASGASGTFQDSGTFTVTAMTSESGLTPVFVFTANGTPGHYTVSAIASSVITPTNFLLTNLTRVFLSLINR
jgi:hypothetical protein